MKVIPAKAKDIRGKKFNLLTVLEFSHVTEKGKTYWFCKCECGGEKVCGSSELRSGGNKSCGCLIKNPRHKNNYKHGQAAKGKHHPLYGRWHAIKARCYRKSSESYADYGGRGIKICDEWLDFQNFFDWSISSGYKEELQIDRIDNSGDYTPDNCRWVTFSENQSNKRSNIHMTIDGKTQNLARWAEESGIGYFTLRGRYLRGDSPEEFLRPVKQYKTNHRDKHLLESGECGVKKVDIYGKRA